MESIISSYHNYWVNGIITSGFVVGDPDADRGFYFLADVMRYPDTRPHISARLYSQSGALLTRIRENRIEENPEKCILSPTASGFIVSDSKGISIFEVSTRHLTNGYLTSIKARLFDDTGNLRMEPTSRGIQVHDPAILGLKKPGS